MTRTRMAHLGPVQIETVAVSDFTKRRFSREDLQSIWHICGPSAEYNLARNPLWIAICMAYIEGLQHGSELGRVISSP
jgi:hypothetical protein